MSGVLQTLSATWVPRSDCSASMLFQIETPDLPAIDVTRRALKRRLLQLPWISKFARLSRRAELTALARKKQGFIEWLISHIRAGDTSRLLPVSIRVSPLRAITDHGAARLASHPKYADLLNDVERYNRGQLQELDFQQSYGFATSAAFGTAFDYLNSLNTIDLCMAWPDTRVYRSGGWAIVLGYQDGQPALAALGVLPCLVDALFPADFSPWTPTEPVWDRYELG